MIERTFRITLANLRTGTKRQYVHECKENKYVEAWKEAVLYAYNELINQDMSWVIEKIEHLIP